MWAVSSKQNFSPSRTDRQCQILTDGHHLTASRTVIWQNFSSGGLLARFSHFRGVAQKIADSSPYCTLRRLPYRDTCQTSGAKGQVRSQTPPANACVSSSLRGAYGALVLTTAPKPSWGSSNPPGASWGASYGQLSGTPSTVLQAGSACSLPCCGGGGSCRRGRSGIPPVVSG